MSDSIAGAGLDVLHPSGEKTRIAIDPVPFRIGRGPDNHLILRDNRASRSHAKISHDGAVFLIEDLASLHGTWVNGVRVQGPTPLQPGDTVEFGFEDSYQLIFSGVGPRIHRMLDRISMPERTAGAAGSLARLRALIEVARSLQTTLARDEVLAAILDAALALTRCRLGFLLLRSEGGLEVRLGRNGDGSPVSRSQFRVPIGAIEAALEQHRDLLSLHAPDSSESISGFCVPLLEFPSVDGQQTIAVSAQSRTIGALYLERPPADSQLSDLDRELLHTLALEASTMLANVELLEQERQKRRMEQELTLARQVQENLLPRKLPQSGWFSAAGSSMPSAEIAGDYFDLLPAGSEAWAAILADVSGKGISSALLASLLQGAFLLASALNAPLDVLFSTINAFLIDRAEGEKYATLFCGIVHRSGSLLWANAGHVEPILLGVDGSVRTLHSTGMPLGLRPDGQFAMETLSLSDGDKLIAFSDGLTEAEGPDSKPFESKVMELLGSCGNLSAQETHDRLMRELLEFRGSESWRDDITLLVIEYRKVSEPAS